MLIYWTNYIENHQLIYIEMLCSWWFSIVMLIYVSLTSTNFASSPHDSWPVRSSRWIASGDWWGPWWPVLTMETHGVGAAHFKEKHRTISSDILNVYLDVITTCSYHFPRWFGYCPHFEGCILKSIASTSSRVNLAASSWRKKPLWHATVPSMVISWDFTIYGILNGI